MISVNIENSGFITPDIAAAKAHFIRQAALGVEFARGLWVQYAQTVGPYRTGAYLRGIQDNARVTVRVTERDWEVLVEAEIVNTCPHAKIVEDGHKAFRLADAIDWSGPNVRRGPNGPYLRIPFRHRAFANEQQQADQGLTYATRRAMMPAAIYAKAQALSAGSEGSKRERLSVDAEMGIRPGHQMASPHGGVDAWRSERGVAGRIKGKSSANPAWKSSKFEGMFRVAHGQSSEYLTVRVITPLSRGWVIPAALGYGLARAVSAELANGEGGRRLGLILQGGMVGSLLGGGRL